MSPALVVSLAAGADDAMRRHAEGGYPLEVCGLLIGSSDEEQYTLREAWPAANAWESDPELRAALVESLGEREAWESASSERRFLVPPAEIAAAMRRARLQGMDVVGVYHTHPEHPAEPSAYDLGAAWEGYAYIILSVREGRVAEVRSWVLDPEARSFVEQKLHPEN